VRAFYTTVYGRRYLNPPLYAYKCMFRNHCWTAEFWICELMADLFTRNPADADRSADLLMELRQLEKPMLDQCSLVHSVCDVTALEMTSKGRHCAVGKHLASDLAFGNVIRTYLLQRYCKLSAIDSALRQVRTKSSNKTIRV